MALYAGEAVGLVRESQPAADIVADLARGFIRAPHLTGRAEPLS
jgi:hypothetical protein